MAHGGNREGAGRKTKAEEVKLIESLTPLAPKALEALKKGIEDGEFQYVKLFYEYYAGKPTDKVDLTSGGQPITDTKHEVVFRKYDKS